MLKRNQREKRYKPVLERSFEIVEDFELNWKPEREDDLENALKGAKELAGEALFRRLLEIDLLLRIENDVVLPEEDYVARFPQYVETIKDVFAKLDELSAGVDEQEYPVPREFEHYRLEEFLGQGVTGCAYRATDLIMRREVAFKFLNPKFDDAESLERFQRELAFNGRLDSEHIVRAYSCGKTADRNWLMMEYVDGDNLERYTLKAPECRLELNEALKIAEQVVLALQKIHDVGLIHRDLKPGNILRRKSDGVVKLSDLGFCVPITSENDDQNQKRFYRPQNDYRGLGETFFFLTTGATFKEPITCPADVVAVRRAYQKARTPVPSKAVLKFVARTLATDRSAQFVSDEELLRAIRRLIQSPKLKIKPIRLSAIVIIIVGLGIGSAIFNANENAVLIQPQEKRPSVVDVGNVLQVDSEKEEINEKTLLDDSSGNSVSSEKNGQNVESPVVVAPCETFSTIVTTPDDVVNPNDGLISLREAIIYAGTGDLGPTITFDQSLKGETLTLNERIMLNKAVVIDASTIYDQENEEPGVTIDANKHDGFFNTKNTLSLVRIALKNGKSVTQGSPIEVFAEFHATDCVFTNCLGVDGGALRAENCNVTIERCLFKNNEATRMGGALRTIGGTVVVSNSHFIENKSTSNGGAIRIDESKSLSIANTRFENNNSSTSAGSVDTCFVQSFNITECDFTDNKAKLGGALRVHKSLGTVASSNFERNSATECGGAIVCGGDLTLDRCVLINNQCVDSGGALELADMGSSTIVNSLIARNVARHNCGGIVLQKKLTLVNSTVVDNFLETGERNDIFSDRGETEAYNSISGFADWTEGESNLVYDGSQKLFVNPELGDYALKEGSAAINAGKNERAQGKVDLRGAKRIVDGTVDIGPYEYQVPAAK